MSDREFEGKTALVTGGARGIGAACCRRLAESGAAVAINYLSSEAAAQRTHAAITSAGGRAHLVKGDVSNPDDVQRIVDETQEKLGPIALVVNNAGIFHFAPHDQTTLEIWRRTLDVNLTGPYLVTWAVKQGMIESGYGRIVNITSIAGLRARPLSIAYAASKGGLIAFTKSLAEALAPYGIRVNAVAPGLIETDILEGVEPAAIERIVQATPMGRIGQPREVAELVHFLLSDKSSFTTGQTIVASGGRVMLP